MFDFATSITLADSEHGPDEVEKGPRRTKPTNHFPAEERVFAISKPA